MTKKRTRQQRTRRQLDPAYRERYNAMRREYYHRMKSDPEYKAKLLQKAAEYRKKKRNERNASDRQQRR